MSRQVDETGLGTRILELLQAGPDTTLELSLCRDGSVRVSKEVGPQ